MTLSTDNVAPVLSFFGTRGASLSISKNHFSQEELFDTLIGLARHDNPKIALAAIKQIQITLREIAEVSGHIARAKVVKESKNEDGSSTHSISTGIVRTPLPNPPLRNPDQASAGSQFIPPPV